MSDNRNDKQRISAAFKSLRKLGYVAKMNFMCCMGCGLAAMPETDKWVFWHQQDDDHAFEKVNRWADKPRNLQHDLMLRWGGDANLIISALRAERLTVEWYGQENRCIQVKAQKVLV